MSHGLHIIPISRLWRPLIYDVSKASSAFIGGTIGHSCWDPSQSLWHWLSWAPLTTKATPCNSYALQPTPSSHTLYGELVNGQRLPGGPKLRYMDHIRRILNKCNISTVELEQLSTDRATWKSACANGLVTYNVAADHAAEDRRTRRHNPPNPPTTGLRCPQCSRICASEFGLRSHLRSHASRPHQQHS